MGQNGPKGKGIINTLSVMQMNIKINYNWEHI